MYQSPPHKLILTQLLPINIDPTPKAKAPVTIELLHFLTVYLAEMGQDYSIKAFLARRDLILLNMSFFGLLRRSDAATLTVQAIQYTPNKGYCLAHIPHSKTDQQGGGYTLPILLHCKLWSWEPHFKAYLSERHSAEGVWFPTYDARSKTLR